MQFQQVYAFGIATEKPLMLQLHCGTSRLLTGVFEISRIVAADALQVKHSAHGSFDITQLTGTDFMRGRDVLHGESNTGQALPQTPTQRTFQPQEAVRP